MVITDEVKGQHYTAFEDKLLLAQVGHVPVRVIAEGLGRTPGSVYERLKVLRRRGLYPPNVRYKNPPRARIRRESENYHYFTEEDDKALCTLFGWFPLKTIAEFLNRLPGSVQSRLRYLKRQGKLDDRFPYGYQKFRPWTEKEEYYLAKNYGKVETSKIAQRLNRAVTAVKRKASALGVRFNSKNYTASQVARLFGVRWEKVRRWVNEGLIEGFDTGVKGRHYFRFPYAAITKFIQDYPGFYDPEGIGDKRLKVLASTVNEGNKYLSVTQAAKKSGIPYHRLTWHLRRGNLQGLLILGPTAQRFWRIRESDLAEWIANSNLPQTLKPTTVLVSGEKLEVWPAWCPRHLNCMQCYIEGRLQCRDKRKPLKLPRIIRWKPEGYSTVKEYAQKQGCSKSWVYELIKRGRLASLRKGRYHFIITRSQTER